MRGIASAPLSILSIHDSKTDLFRITLLAHELSILKSTPTNHYRHKHAFILYKKNFSIKYIPALINLRILKVDACNLCLNKNESPIKI